MTTFETEHQRTLDTLLLSLGVTVWSLDDEGAQSILEGMLTDGRVVRLTVTDAGGEVFAAVGDDRRDKGRLSLRSASLRYRGETLAQVTVAMDVSPDLEALIGTQLVYSFQVFAQMILSVAALLWQLRRRFLGPLILLEEQASQLSRRQLDEAFVWTRNDELGHLGNSLERTRLDLRASFADLEARVAERTRELEAFSYSVSHDLRAPLRVIRSYSDLLEEDLGSTVTDQARHDLDRIRLSVKKMGRLIEDLLGLSLVGRAEMVTTPLDLLALIRSIWNDLEEKDPGRRVTLTTRGEFSAEGDRALVEIALRNLLDNAWKYTSQQATAEVTVWTEVSEGRRWLHVRDNGPGFESSRATDLFEPFQRLHSDREFPGNGIGLAIVKRVVDRHGGLVRARSLAEGGAEFSFSLEVPR